jgi:hypothetical protein
MIKGPELRKRTRTSVLASALQWYPTTSAVPVVLWCGEYELWFDPSGRPSGYLNCETGGGATVRRGHLGDVPMMGSCTIPEGSSLSVRATSVAAKSTRPSSYCKRAEAAVLVAVNCRTVVSWWYCKAISHTTTDTSAQVSRRCLITSWRQKLGAVGCSCVRVADGE